MNNSEKDKLIKRINDLEKELKESKQYGLVWEKEKVLEKVVKDCENKIPLLSMCQNKDVINSGEENLLIEGDNYHSLIALNYIYRGKIDFIYIDPPYNTGHDDFVYNDKFVNEEDGYRHSKWLSFMQKRLQLARELLSDDGLIFISIDDNELYNLKLLCDSIFDEKSYLGTLIWAKKRKGSFLSKKIVSLTEYVLVYAKKSSFKVSLYGGKADSSESQPIVKRTNAVSSLTFKGKTVQTKLKDGVYKKGKYGEDVNLVILNNDIHVKNNLILNDFTLTAHFTWSQEFLEHELRNGTKVVINTTNLQPRVYRVYKDNNFKGFPSLINGIQISGTNEDAYEMLEKIFNQKKVFDYSKPVNFIKLLVDGASHFKKNAIVLDFFAGSGTTAQAVLELNKEDDGKRKFIICTNNEGKICEDVTYPRIKTVITGKRKDGSKYSDGIKGNLRYLKTSFIPHTNNRSQDKYNLVEKIDPLLCIVEDTYKNIERDDCSSHYSTDDGMKHLFIYNDFYNERKFRLFKNKVEEAVGTKCVYIFNEDNLVDDNLFKNKSIKVKPIPAKIYEIYTEIVKDIKGGN